MWRVTVGGALPVGGAASSSGRPDSHVSYRSGRYLPTVLHRLRFPFRSGLAIAAAALLASCTLGLERVRQPGRATAVATTGPWASMIYLARTDSGVIAVDLGWLGAEKALAQGLKELDATPDDVVAVFLTHGHRDHVHGWPAVRRATFYVATPEVPRLTGEESPRAWLPRLVDRLSAPPLPKPGDLRIVAFSRDTAVVVGSDTVRLYLVPGHTPGSAAFVLRRTLFGGDALARTPLYGFRAAKPQYSEDVERSKGSVRWLFARIEPLGVHTACTAHAKCARFDDEFRRAVLR